jgi:large subunit ribosomal protein L28
MSKVCEITGKRPVMGYSVSHSNNHTKRRFYPNLRTKKFFIPEENRWITLKVSTKAIKTINKNGISAVLRDLKKNKGIDLLAQKDKIQNRIKENKKTYLYERKAR